MKQFSHIGIPTQTVQENETYMKEVKLYVTDFSESENNIEWLRFEKDSPMPKELQTTAHVAFQVDDLNAALEGQDILIEPFEAAEGVKVAFILENGAPVEFMEVNET